MKKNIKFFYCGLLAVPFLTCNAHSANCSKLSLIRCLDSACAINIGTNSAARCQLCGTAGAGTPPVNNAIQQLSIGVSANTVLTDVDLKSAPSDPGKRYIWATEQCSKKISGCTTTDVSNNYDSLIEQSCTAAGINSKMSELQSAASKTKSADTCKSEITICMLDKNKCDSNYSGCKSDTEFNNFFSLCAASSAGDCTQYISDIRNNVISARDTSIKTQENLINKIAETYQNARLKKINSATDSCANNSAKNSCTETVCKNNMEHGCTVGYESEKSMAAQLCEFYDKACNSIKK